MGKKIFSTLLAFVIVFSALCVDASVVEAFAPVPGRYRSGDFWYVLDKEGKACVEYYFGRDKEVIVPAEFDGHEVVAIGDDAFNDQSDFYNIKSVTLPEGITEIGWCAFFECESLETINLPESLKKIRMWAFSGCTSLKDIKIPSGVESIDDEAFVGTGFYNDSSNWKDYGLYMDGWLLDVKSGCSSHFKIKKGTTNLADGLFSGIYKEHVTKVSIPASLKRMGLSPISYDSAIKSVAINKENPYFVYEGGVIYSPDRKIIYDVVNVPSSYRVAPTVTTIMPDAIDDNSAIKKLVLPKSVKEQDISSVFVYSSKSMIYCAAPKSKAPHIGDGELNLSHAVYNYAVRKPSTSVTLYKKQMATVTVGGKSGGEEYTYFYEANTESPGNGVIKWSSSNKKVMKVSYNDVTHKVKITGLKKGTAYLVAKNSAGKVIRKYKFKIASPNPKAKVRKISLNIKKGSRNIVRVTDKSLNGRKPNGRIIYEVTTSDASVVNIDYPSYQSSDAYDIWLEAKGKGTANVVIKNVDTGKTVAKIKVTV